MALVRDTSLITTPFNFEKALEYINNNNEIIYCKRERFIMGNLPIPTVSTTSDGTRSVTYKNKLQITSLDGYTITNLPINCYTDEIYTIACYDTKLQLITDYTTLGGEV